jgi:23S rRNA (adenine2503-C2)-methyltransferase
MTIQLKNLTADELHARLADAGVTLRAARMLQAAAIRRDEYPSPAPGLSGSTLEKIRERTLLPNLTVVDATASKDVGFKKYLFRGDGPDAFEAVRIPLLHRPHDPKYIVCVSSQVGCALGCAFCATGRMGFRRDLATWEIVDQVVKIQADSPHPVRGVVFMGMGEPLLNYDAVITAARILSEPCGGAISAKAITVCTAGIVPAIRRFTAEQHPFRLIVSLNFADPARRREFMPIESKYPTPELIQALREYHEVTARRVTLAWTMISGVNTREEDARVLADLTRGLPVKLDLIDVNDATVRFKPPSPEELNAFRDALRKHLSQPVARRYSGGADIRSGCGMLVGLHSEARWSLS